MIKPVAMPTAEKNGVGRKRVNTSDAKAAYNPMTDQYIHDKMMHNPVRVSANCRNHSQ
ncbi:MAG: hypothetical protein AAF391_00495 [Bacteroidota bacterium]